MRSVIITILAMLVLVTAGGITFIYAGVYDVAATSPHWPTTYWIMDTVRVQSVKARATGLTPPFDLSDRERILAGTDHFAAHCASCHGGPGVPRADLANGLYPQPADLARSVERYAAGELFWILKNGIKMSGMPAWRDHDDEELWSTVAFLKKLPGMSEVDYGKLIMENMHRGGGRHGGHGSMQGMDHGSMPGMDHDRAPAAGHDH